MSTLTHEGVAFVHAPSDKKLYYYTAAKPTIAVQQKTGGELLPNLDFKVYRTGTGPFYGTLMLATKVSIEEDQARDAARALNLPVDAELVPLPLTSSEMTVGLPGMFGATNNAAINNGSLSIIAQSFDDKTSIQRLDALLRDPQTASSILVWYKQDYLIQLEPSEFELEINWSKVYDYLKTSVGIGVLIFSARIEKISSNLLEDKSINIRINGRNPDTTQYFDKAAKMLTSVMLTNFFQVDVPSPKDHGKDPAPVFGFSLKQVRIEDVQKQHLTARMTESTVVRRSIFPQTTFDQLVAGTVYDYDKVVTTKDLTDPFFSNRKLTFYLIDEKWNPAIEQIAIDVKYNTTEKTLYFNKKNFGPQVFETALETRAADLSPVAYRYKIQLADSLAGVVEIQSEEIKTTAQQAFLDIEALLGQYTFAVDVAPTFDWGWYKSVTITLRGENPASEGKEAFEKQFVLIPEKSSYDLTLNLPHLNQFQFDATFKYEPATNSAHLPMTVTRPVAHRIRAFEALHPQKVVTIKSSYDWTVIKKVYVYLRFEYATDKFLQESFNFTAETPSAVVFSADQPDASFNTVYYKAIIIQKDDSSQIFPMPKPDYLTTDANEISLPK